MNQFVYHQLEKREIMINNFPPPSSPETYLENAVFSTLYGDPLESTHCAAKVSCIHPLIEKSLVHCSYYEMQKYKL